MNQTIWITNIGQVIPCPPNGHYNFISQNFVQYFGRKPLHEGDVHDTPYTEGWVHIQNHFQNLNIRGSEQGMRRNLSKIRNVIFERLMVDREFSVNIEYNNKACINPNGASYRFKMPDQYDDLKNYLG